MSIFDEGVFIACDSDGIGPNEPADTWTEAIIDHQLTVQEITAGEQLGVPLSGYQTSRSTYTREKPYASTAWTCVWVAPMVIEPTLEELKLTLVYRVSSEVALIDRTRDPAVQVRLELDDLGSVTTTLEEAVNFTTTTLSLALNSIKARGLRLARLWIRSNAVRKFQRYSFPGADVQESLIYRNPSQPQHVVLGVGDIVLYPNDTFPPPQANSWETQSVSAYGDAPIHDIVIFERSTYDSDYGAPILTPRYNYGAARFTYDLGYIQLRALHVEGVHRAKSLTPQARRALIPNAGWVGASHALRTKTLIERPRPALLAHQGRRPVVEEDWSSRGLTERWIYGSLNPPFEPICQEHLWVDDAAPFIDVYFLVACVLPDDSFSLPEPELEQLVERAYPGELELNVRLSQYNIAGGLSTIDFATVSASMLAYRTERSGHWPLLTQMMWRELGDTTISYTQKEGQLFERDFELLTLVGVTLDGALLSESDSGLPLHLELQTQDWTFGPAVDVAAEGLDKTDLRYVIVGISAYTRHEASEV